MRPTSVTPPLTAGPRTHQLKAGVALLMVAGVPTAVGLVSTPMAPHCVPPLTAHGRGTTVGRGRSRTASVVRPPVATLTSVSTVVCEPSAATAATVTR